MLTKINIRQATADDLPSIVAMLADDFLGKTREVCTVPLPKTYYDAFKVIHNNPDVELLVAEWEGQIIGTAQINYITCLTYQGGIRALIEDVRVDTKYRAQGFGQQLIKALIGKAKAKKCFMMELTTNKKRIEAKRFYEKLGFVASHEGMKLVL